MKKLTLTALVLGLGAMLPLMAADAAANYKAHCAKCHGADGAGKTKMGQKAGCKDYTNADVQAKLNDDHAFKSLKQGMKEGDKELMAAFGEKLSDDEIKALIAYMRTFKK